MLPSGGVVKHWRKYVAVAVVFCICEASVVAAPANTVSMKQQLTDFGVGADLKLKLAGGKKMRGSIEALDDSGVVVAEHGKKNLHIPYTEVAQVKLAERAYRAKGQPDALQASRVVVSLGVGRHAVVKFLGRELHGHIQLIGPDSFTLLPDHSVTPVEIAYSDVSYVEKNLTAGATIVLVVLIVAAVVVITSVAATR